MRGMLEAMIRGEVPPPPVARLVGMRLVEIGDGEARFELEADPERHANPMGTLHGGILCDLVDAAMGCAYASRLGEGETFTTLELKINFLKPVWSGLLTARARHRARRPDDRPRRVRRRRRGRRARRPGVGDVHDAARRDGRRPLAWHGPPTPADSPLTMERRSPRRVYRGLSTPDVAVAIPRRLRAAAARPRDA